MRQTSIWSLVWIGLAASPLGWLVAEAVQTWTMRLPPIPWILPALLLFCVVLLWLAERMVRGWISERRFDQRMNPLRVARLLALAKASAVFGAVATGAYTGIAVDRKSTRLNSSHVAISYAVFCLKKQNMLF